MCAIIAHQIDPIRLKFHKGCAAPGGCFRYDDNMGAKLLGFVAAVVLAVFLAGCNSNEDKYVVQTPVPPAPQQGQGTGH